MAISCGRFRARTLLGIGMCGLLAGLAAVNPGAAQESLPTITPDHSRGQWQERVPVSGGVRVGVVVWQLGSFNRHELIVTLPPKRPERLCIEISSRDGRYSALLEYGLAKAPAGRVKAAVDAQDLEKLSAAAAEDVAILASLSSDCTVKAPAQYLIAAWHPPNPSETVTVLLNSRVPTSIVRDGDTPPVACAELSGATTAYNLRCDLPREWLDKTSRNLTIVQRRGRSEARLPLPLILMP